MASIRLQSQKLGRGQLEVPASGSLAVGDVHLATGMERHASYRPHSRDGKPLQIQTLDGDFTFEGRAVRYVEVFVGNSYDFHNSTPSSSEPWVEAYRAIAVGQKKSPG